MLKKLTIWKWNWLHSKIKENLKYQPLKESMKRSRNFTKQKRLNFLTKSTDLETKLMKSTERKSKSKQNTIRIFFCWEMRFKTKLTSEKPAKPHIMRPFVNFNQESITCKELSHLSSVRLKVHTMNKESELNKHTEQKLAKATKLSRK